MKFWLLSFFRHENYLSASDILSSASSNQPVFKSQNGKNFGVILGLLARLCKLEHLAYDTGVQVCLWFFCFCFSSFFQVFLFFLKMQWFRRERPLFFPKFGFCLHFALAMFCAIRYFVDFCVSADVLDFRPCGVPEEGKKFAHHRMSWVHRHDLGSSSAQ